MSFFEYFNEGSDGYLDVYKDIQFVSLNLDEYKSYKPLKDDNLMNISHRFYGTIEDWWIIYFFNTINKTLTTFPNDDMLFIKIDEIEAMIDNYDNLPTNDRNYVYTLILEFYKLNNDILTSIALTTDYINVVDLNERFQFRDYMFDKFVSDFRYCDELRIPSLNNVYKMKQQMNEYNIRWGNYDK